MEVRERSAARRRTTGRVAFVVTVVVLAIDGLHWLWGSGLQPGVDVTGHLTRLGVGLDLFTSFSLDGWFDRSMLGYQTFLMYGPGLAFAVATVRVLSVGLLSIPGALEVVTVAALIALVPAAAALTRAFGLSVAAGRAGGLLALAVSSTRGGGIQGAFDLGLLPNTLAAPLVLWAWALLVSHRPRPVLLGVVVAAVGITHPQSVIVLVGFAPFVLVAGRFCGTLGDAWAATLARAGVIAAGISAWWWVPAVMHRDLRGILTSWDLPTFNDHLWLIVRGERGWIGAAALLVVVTWSIAVVHGLLRRDRAELALAALPLLALGSLHLAQWVLEDGYSEVVLFPNRGLTYAAYLAIPVVALVLDRILGRRPFIPWLVAAIVVALTLPDLRPPESVFDTPTDDLRATAETLADSVPDGGRFAFVYAPGSSSGVPATGRWLGWTSGRADLGPFGAEYAPGVENTLLVFDPPDRQSVDGWIEQVRPLSVTHIVTAEPDSEAVFAYSDMVDEVARHGSITVWEIGSSPIFRVVAAERERMVWDVDLDGERQLPLPVGWSPGWSATVDGDAATSSRTPDGRLSIPYPGGAHRIEIDFDLPPGRPLGWTISALTVLVLAVSPRARGRRARDRRSPEHLQASPSDEWPDLR